MTLMNAVVLEQFGGPENFTVQQVPRPVPAAGQILVRNVAAAVNPVDLGNRHDGSWAGLTPPVVLGSDFSGVVEDVGEGVSRWAVGDEVFGVAPFLGNQGGGTYAEYHAIDATLAAPKPTALDHNQAAAVPLAACTAYDVLRRLTLAPQEWLLIHGAGGGVGTFAVQMARNAGVRVIASASARHHDLLAELGAAACIDYTCEDVVAAARTHAGGAVDAIADFVGGETLANSLPALRRRGRAATIAGLLGDLDLAIDSNHTLHGVLLDVTDASLLRAVARELELGRLRPVVSEVMPLRDVADAHRRIETGHMQGKIVLEVDHDGSGAGA
jgi:NADPH:quinone reductase